jgi:cytochrome c biogenesis protein CcmG/thiol:disulfide interchange protein DsbE
LSAYKGKVVLLNFWATWCHGCQEEIPWFVQFESKYKQNGLAVIGVSMDDDGWKSVKPFLEEKKLNYTIVIGNEPLGKLYGLSAMPMTLLIDREGKIAASYSGVVDKEKCESDLQALLGSPGKNSAK